MIFIVMSEQCFGAIKELFLSKLAFPYHLSKHTLRPLSKCIIFWSNFVWHSLESMAYRPLLSSYLRFLTDFNEMISKHDEDNPEL